jgi:LysM repeat protein
MGIKEIKYQLYLITLSLFIVSNSFYAQELNLNNYHIVNKGETSYGIAKKYNIDLNKFFELNPSASNGINKGDTLTILFSTKADKTTNLQTIDSSRKVHQVLVGETLWSIAKNYGVKVENIKEVNQFSNNELELDQLIYIPNQLSDTNDIVTPLIKKPPHPLLGPCDTLIIHKVKKKETLYGIATNYNISIDKIIKINPELNKQGLQKDQKLKVVCKMTDCNEDSILKLIYEKSLVIDSNLVENNLNVSVILPFSLDLFDTILNNCEDPSICPLTTNSVNSIKMLNGIQLAFEDLKNRGYNLNVNIFDTEYDTNKIKVIIDDSVFKNSNLIIGPIYSKNIKLVRSFSRSKKIPMISLYDIPNQALFRYPDLYKFYPSNATQTQSLAKYLKINNKNYNNVLLTNKERAKSLSYGKVFSSTFNDTIINNDSSFVFDSIKSIELKRGDNFFEVKKQLSKNDTNIIIIADTDIPFMTYVFNKVIELSNSKQYYNYNFSIAGFEGLLKMNTIDEKYKEKYNIHFVSKGQINFNSEGTIEFLNTYQDTFEMKADKISIIAYDLILSIFNKVYPDNNKAIYNGIFNNVDFQKIGEYSGYENKAVKLFRYKNYNLQKISQN